MEVRIKVCDVCEDPTRQVTTYTVTADGRSGTTDRCTEHSEALEAILGVREARKTAPVAPRPAQQAARTVSTPAKRAGRARITTMDEIEAGKRR